MATGAEIAKAAPDFMGRSYADMDCQEYVERVLQTVGIKKNLAGSNAWLRFLSEKGWIGTPEQCKEIFGCIPVGAFLFILKHDGKEPERYKQDGIGNASHIGIYTGMTENEMRDAAIAAGVAPGTAKDCTFGSGAMHSSQSRGKVCTSSFKGRSISGGWNMVGLWDEIAYTDAGIGKDPADGTNKKTGGDVGLTGTVWAESGGTVNLRSNNRTSAGLVDRVPIGSEVEIMEPDVDGWSMIRWHGKTGWMQSRFIVSGSITPADPDAEQMILIPKSKLQEMREMLDELMNGARG